MIGQLFQTIFVSPITNGLILFYNFFLSLHIPGAFGFAVIGLTVVIRLLLHPFMQSQIDTSKKMQRIKPHLDALSKKHKNDKVKLQEEQARLYKEHNINPMSGCLFMILQIPLVLALYQTLSMFLTKSPAEVIATVNKAAYAPFLHVQAVDPLFFGLNLAFSPAKSGIIWYMAVPIITGLLQYLQARVTTQVTNPTPVKAADADKPKKDGKKNEAPAGDFQQAMNMQMKYFMPVMIGVFSYQLPIGLSLYWNIFSLFSIIQYRSSKA